MYVVLFKSYGQSPWKAYTNTYKTQTEAFEHVERMLRNGTFAARFVKVADID